MLTDDQPQTLDIPAARPVFRIGRTRTWHLAKVLIEDDANGQARVVVRSRCGLERGEFTETYAIPTCEACVAAVQA